MSQEWVELPPDAAVEIGDVIRVWSRVAGMGKVPTALEMEHVARKVEQSDPRFRVEGWSYPDEERKFFVRIRIVEPRAGQVQLAGALTGAVVTAAVLGVIGVALGIWALGYSERRVGGVGEKVAETAEKAAWGLAKWAAVAIVGYMAVKAVGGKA